MRFDTLYRFLSQKHVYLGILRKTVCFHMKQAIFKWIPFCVGRRQTDQLTHGYRRKPHLSKEPIHVQIFAELNVLRILEVEWKSRKILAGNGLDSALRLAAKVLMEGMQ